jgi:hypothetical protein
MQLVIGTIMTPRLAAYIDTEEKRLTRGRKRGGKAREL